MNTMTVGGSRSPLSDKVGGDEIYLLDNIAFLSVHLGCALVWWVGISPTAVIVACLLYFVRMFAVTAGYHRYFSHKSFRTGRLFQFILGFIATSSGQMGPLWWAANHRYHHRFSDTELDIHSTKRSGFFWSHVGWIMCRRLSRTNLEVVPDLARYPELRFIDEHYALPPMALALSLAGAGAALRRWAPHLGVSALQLLTWGFFVSTTVLYHATFSINSLAHVIGRQRYETGDQSRNSLMLAIPTLGEGWHNNHHRYPFSERQGLFWWEIDLTHYMIRLLELLGLVWDIREPPESFRQSH